MYCNRFKSAFFVALIMLLSTIALAQAESKTSIQPPIAKKVPYKTTIHDQTLIDNYHWLQDKTNPEVIAYLKAENDYAQSVMNSTKDLQDTLYREILSRTKEADVDVPYKLGEYFYYSKEEEGKQYKVHCRKKGTLSSKEEVILDINALAKGKSFMSVSQLAVSPNGAFLAYTYDDTGFRQYKLALKNLHTGKHLTDSAQRVGSVVWANDNKTLFYSQEDAVAKRQHRLYRHILNTNAKDTLIYQEDDERYSVGAYKSRDDAYIFMLSASLTASEAQLLDAKKPLDDFRIMRKRQNNVEYYPDHSGGFFYFRTNDKGENFRLTRLRASEAIDKPWEEVIAHRKDVMLNSVAFFKDFTVFYERENGLETLSVIDSTSKIKKSIPFSDKAYSAYPGINREYETAEFRYVYESPIVPPSVYSYNVKTGISTLLKKKDVPNYDPSRYLVERILAKAPDGVNIPISLVRLKKTLDKSGPIYLTAYGSYGNSWDPGFNASVFSLVDRGVVVAIAHIRGGGEMGKAWHDAGRMMNKRNSFTDFIACAEYLVSSGYGSKSRLVVSGGSAGGLLMGAVTNLRPDLFKAVYLAVPFVDVINTMLDETLPLTVGEFEEWGNPKEKEAFDYMMSYSPYDNIRAKDYPNILIKTSLNDSQVMYWEPAKYAAKMRAFKTDKNTLLFKTDLEPSGHGGASGRYDRIKERAFDYAYLLDQAGISK